jgi:hypothetical protein
MENGARRMGNLQGRLEDGRIKGNRGERRIKVVNGRLWTETLVVWRKPDQYSGALICEICVNCGFLFEAVGNPGEESKLHWFEVNHVIAAD